MGIIQKSDTEQERLTPPPDEDGGGPAARRQRRAGNNSAVREARKRPSNARERELRRLLAALRNVRLGDFSTRMPPQEDPLMAEIADAFNDLAALPERLMHDVVRVSTAVGREGRMDERVSAGQSAEAGRRSSAR